MPLVIWFITAFHGATSEQVCISHCNAVILSASLWGQSLPDLLAAYIITAPDWLTVVGLPGCAPGPSVSTMAGMRPSGVADKKSAPRSVNGDASATLMTRYFKPDSASAMLARKPLWVPAV